MTSKRTVLVTKMNNKQNSLNRYMFIFLSPSPIIHFILDFMVSRKGLIVNTFPDKLVFNNPLEL